MPCLEDDYLHSSDNVCGGTASIRLSSLQRSAPGDNSRVTQVMQQRRRSSRSDAEEGSFGSSSRLSSRFRNSSSNNANGDDIIQKNGNYEKQVAQCGPTEEVLRSRIANTPELNPEITAAQCNAHSNNLLKDPPNSDNPSSQSILRNKAENTEAGEGKSPGGSSRSRRVRCVDESFPMEVFK